MYYIITTADVKCLCGSCKTLPRASSQCGYLLLGPLEVLNSSVTALGIRCSNYIILGKSDNYSQVTWAGLGCNSGNPSADKDPLKAENPKITTRPRLGLIESFIRYHANIGRKRNSAMQNNSRIQGFQGRFHINLK